MSKAEIEERLELLFDAREAAAEGTNEDAADLAMTLEAELFQAGVRL